MLYNDYISQTTLNNYGIGSLNIRFNDAEIRTSSSFFGMIAGSNQPMTDIDANIEKIPTANGVVMNWEVNADQFKTNPFVSSVKKIFLVDKVNDSKKLVALVTFNRVEPKSGGNGYYIYYDVRDIFNFITTTAGTYTLGIRSSDT